MQGPVQETSSCGKSLGDFQIGYDLPTDCKGVIGRVLPQQTGLRQVKLWIRSFRMLMGNGKPENPQLKFPEFRGLRFFRN